MGMKYQFDLEWVHPKTTFPKFPDILEVEYNTTCRDLFRTVQCSDTACETNGFKNKRVLAKSLTYCFLAALSISLYQVASQIWKKQI